MRNCLEKSSKKTKNLLLIKENKEKEKQIKKQSKK